MPLKKIVIPKYEIYLDYREESSGGEAKNPEDRWTSHEDRYIEFYPQALYTQRQDFQETITVSWPPIDGDKVWMVVVRYQSGNTFGTSHGNWKIVGAFLDPEIARNISEIIAKYPGENRWDSPPAKKGLSHQESLRQELLPYLGENFYIPWIGYFERYENVEIHEMTLTSGPESTDASIKYFKH